MKKVRVNVRSLANTKAVRKEKRNGRDVIIVPSATLPDDVVMNGIKYPAAEIAKSYLSLNRTPAPHGHPKVNGKYVSAFDPEGLNVGYVGAWNENARQENGRVFLDKVIDVEVANRSEEGKAILNAIEKGEPVHTSTGLLCELEHVANCETHKSVARNIEFDHDAILLNEEGAATPEQGVGMLVNGQDVEVINSFIESADQDLEWALDSVARALERRQRAGFLERMKTALIEAFGSGRETSTNEKELPMTVSKEQFDELSVKVNALSESIGKIDIAAAVANAIKPLTDNLAEIQANAKAKDEAEKADLVAKVVKANLLSEGAAKELTINALKELADKAKPGKAAAINGAGFNANGADDEFAGIDLNAGLEGK